MRRWMLILAGMGLLLSAPVRPANSDEDLSLQMYLGLTVFEACGLDKLEPEELERLSWYLVPPGLESFEVESALAFLEQEGWEPLTLYEGVKEDPDFSFSDLRHLAFTGDRQMVLEQNWSSSSRLPAGHYLAKVGAFSVEILDVYGEARRLSIESD